MPALIWSEQLALQHPETDATHQEFVALLAAADDCLLPAAQGDEGRIALLAAYAQLQAHTEDHFNQEDRWMAATGFEPDNCHARQHKQVLDIFHEVQRLALEENDFGPMQRLITELAQWFPMHVDSMDAPLTEHLKRVGFDPTTGISTHLPEEMRQRACNSDHAGACN